MSATSNDALVSVLSEILADKQNTTENVEKLLNLICKNFDFDCGLVYEIDQRNEMNLKEHCVPDELRFRERFGIDQIDVELRLRLSKESLVYACKTSTTNPYELDLLKFFFAESLVIASVIDEETRIRGFVVFMNIDTEHPICSEVLPQFKFLLNLLEKCLQVRVYQNKLHFAQNALESILDNTGIDIYVNDFYTHEILYANRSMAAPYGGKHKFNGKKCWEVLFPSQRGPCEFCPQKKLLDETGCPSKIYSWNYQRPFDGAWYRVFSAAFRWVDGRLAHVVSSADITENKRNEALIDYMASYDSLTGLPNRRMLLIECENRITNASENAKGFLLFFDIDGFKAINDNFGHSAGDEFLVQLGKFFSNIPMLAKSIYRNGGDEFVAILSAGVTENHIINLASFIHERFKNPWQLSCGSVYCNTSIGVACYPKDGLTAEELINKADQAMYYIKQSGGGGVAFYGEQRPRG